MKRETRLQENSSRDRIRFQEFHDDEEKEEKEEEEEEQDKEKE